MSLRQLLTSLLFVVRRSNVVLWSCLLAVLALSLATAHAAESYYEKTLAEKNIAIDSDGLKEYLTNLHPNEQQRERALKLIQALGDADSFANREDAMAKLLVLPVLPNEALIAASTGKDPEIRWRAAHILKLGKPESDRVLFAAFKTIEEKPITNIAAEIIRAIPLCDKTYMQYAARQALRASATASDATLLRRELKNENVEIRIAAIYALERVLKDKAATDLQSMMKDEDNRVKLAAARALANFGDRSSLATLENLLAAEEKQVQTAAAVALRQATGQRFSFSAYDDVAKQKAAIAKWKTWLASDGKTAKLNFPLQEYGAGVSYLGGNTLLAFGTHNKVVEYDPSGKEVWSFRTAQNAWSAEKLANGNVLIGINGPQGIIEVDRKGTIVWQYRASSPLNAKQLTNGNYLIADWGANQVLEVDAGKNIVWRYQTKSQCGDAHRLENGNTLVSEYQGNIKEVTPDGEVVWQYPATNCYGIQPLPSGNVLITNLNGPVLEVTREKKIIWETSEPGAVDAFRLPNGNTLITGNSRFIEVAPDKKIVWSKAGTSYGTARR